VNCHRNYPWYRAWHDTFAEKGLTVIGIHTPETGGERKVENVQAKVVDAKFTFPVLIDNEKKNWNAWGNSMWPSVYLVDKSGYIRYWRYGELNWQGNEGEKIMREKIEELLAEPR
jgi:hypothetical protein